MLYVQLVAAPAEPGKMIFVTSVAVRAAAYTQSEAMKLFNIAQIANN
jgi:hypothetical protein